ncbi:MAG: acyltransferase [Acidobacteriota bacterium]|nr:acyltransferase [Acidobacteriota bacterium]
MNPISPARLPQLDFLRAVAIILVIGNHSSICPPEASLFFNRITTVWFRGGWTGVDLFFVLSGFLISGLLFNEYKKRGDVDIKKFLVRRGFKIYPAFWFLILTTFVINLLTGEMIWRGGYLSELLFIQNYHPGIWQHTWSLAVEEHFYIFLSLLFSLFLFLDRKSHKNSFDFIPKLFFAIAAICLLFRFITAAYLPFHYEVNIEQTHLRIDSLFFGVFLSYLWNLRGLSASEFLEKNKILIGLAGATCFVPAFVFELEETAWMWTIGLTMLYLGAGCLLLALLKTDFRESKILHLIARIGKYSYSIYLWNLPVHIWLMKFTNFAADNWFLYAFIYWTGTFILGIGTAKLVEYPVLRLRDKIMPSHVSALKPA